MVGEGWGFPDLLSGQKPWCNWYLTPVVNFCEVPEDPVNQIHSPHSHFGAAGIFSYLLRSVQILKREWGAESNESNRTYSIPGKSAALVPEFAVKDLPSAELHPRFLRFQWRTCPWAENPVDYDNPW